MYILTVVVLLLGQEEPTLTNKVVIDQPTCLMAAKMIDENIKKADTVFYIIACKPMEGNPA